MTPLARHLSINLRLARLGTFAAVAASLLLGACSASTDLLPSIAMKPESENSKDEGPSSPQSELQKATVYWGNEFAKKPNDLNAALSYAKNLKAMGEKSKALAVLQQASALHGTDLELASEYGRLALEADQVGLANQLLTTADDPAKPDWRVVSARGTVLAKQGKYADAIPFYERALTLAPNNPSVMNNLAMAYAMNGDAKKAEGILRDAVATPGAKPKVRENLALVLGLQGRYDESKAAVATVLNSDVAEANTEYLKQMVKLDARSAMPDEKSFATNTSVEPSPAMASFQPAKATASASAAATQNLWQTNTDHTTGSLQR